MLARLKNLINFPAYDVDIQSILGLGLFYKYVLGGWHSTRNAH